MASGRPAQRSTRLFIDVHEGEEIFVLRAQDSFAPEAIEMWALTAGMRGAKREKVEAARACAQRMRLWQAEHGSKIPD